MTTMINYSQLLQTFGTSDLFETLAKGIFPHQFDLNDRYDELLFNDVLGYILHDPMFLAWRNSLTVDATKRCVRIGMKVPVISTGYNLSVLEVKAMRHKPSVAYNFMKSMAKALNDHALPLDEVFALILEGIYTVQFINANNIENVH